MRADYLVERGGSRYVAEVKTGAKATDPFFSDTRRQLLEYRVLYDVKGAGWSQENHPSAAARTRMRYSRL